MKAVRAPRLKKMKREIESTKFEIEYKVDERIIGRRSRGEIA